MTRFTNDREKPSPSKISDRPWSLSPAVERSNAIARNDRLDDYDEMNYVYFNELL